MALVGSGFKVWQATLNGHILGQVMKNVFFYYASAAGTAGELASLLSTNLIPAIIGATSVKAIYDNFTVEGVQLAVDLYVAPENVTGTVTGDCLPATNCWAFTLQRGDINSRNGYKRFAGVPESQQVDGIALPGFVTSTLQPLADALANDIPGATVTYQPCIQTTRFAKTPVVPPVYRTFLVASYKDISTQNTRKPGHGS